MPNAVVTRTNGQMFLDPNDGSSARVPIADNEPARATYSVFIGNFTPAASPTDIIVIQGSPTKGKIVRLRQIIITGTATAAANVQMIISRRSTANAGGVFTPQALGSRNVGNDPATATLNLYTTNPTTLGTLVSVPDGGRLNLAPQANGSIDRLILQYGWLNDQAPAIVGVTDFLTIGFGQVALAMPAGGSFDFNIVLSEDGV